MSKLSPIEQLIKEIKKGNIDKAKDLLTVDNLNLNTLDKKTGKNILQLAIEAQEPQLISTIIQHPSVNLQLTNASGDETIFQTAVLFEDIDTIKRLLAKKVDPSKSNSKQHNAIYTAVHSNKPDALKVIWMYDAELVNKEAMRCFEVGIQNGCDEVCLFLARSLELKETTRVREETGNLIHLAVEANKTGIVKELLTRIKDSEDLTPIQKEFAINSQNSKGDTYLHIAYRNDYQTMIGILQSLQDKIFLNKEIKNQKGESIKDILRKGELSKEAEIRRQEKLKQQKKQREIEKEELSKREILQMEKEKAERKREEKVQAAEEKKEKVVEAKKRGGMAVLLILVVLLVTYFGINHVIKSSPKRDTL